MTLVDKLRTSVLLGMTLRFDLATRALFTFCNSRKGGLIGEGTFNIF